MGGFQAPMAFFVSALLKDRMYLKKAMDFSIAFFYFLSHPMVGSVRLLLSGMCFNSVGG
jgi:hypothetical protein